MIYCGHKSKQVWAVSGPALTQPTVRHGTCSKSSAEGETEAQRKGILPGTYWGRHSGQEQQGVMLSAVERLEPPTPAAAAFHCLGKDS